MYEVYPRHLLPAAALLLAASCTADDPRAAADGGAPGPGMVRLPGGTFVLGAGDGAADERPVRAVTLRTFDLDRVEVSQGEWKACMDAGACDPVICQDSPYWDPARFPERPALCMTWQQAADYCAFRGKRLPSEAEWERAARGAEGRRFAWGDAAPDCAHADFGPCTSGYPTDVDSLADGATPEGVLHLTGNVREWVADWYAADAYAEGGTSNPTGPATGRERVVRGGSFAMDGGEGGPLRASARDRLVPIGGAFDLGLRCAR